MRVNKLDLNQLVLLDAMLATASVSKAATLVHLSQPAVSAALAKFRQYFGDPLLVPHGRRLTLTPFAHTLVEPVREALLQVRAALARRQRHAAGIGRLQRRLREMESPLRRRCQGVHRGPGGHNPRGRSAAGGLLVVVEGEEGQGSRA